MKSNKLPIDGYVLDHSLTVKNKLYTCSYCGKPTSNYSIDTVTREMEYIHMCDTCCHDWMNHKPFD